MRQQQPLGQRGPAGSPHEDKATAAPAVTASVLPLHPSTNSFSAPPRSQLHGKGDSAAPAAQLPRQRCPQHQWSPEVVCHAPSLHPSSTTGVFLEKRHCYFERRLQPWSTTILIVAAALLRHRKSCSEGVRQQPIHERRHCTTGLLQALGVKNNVVKRFNF